MDCEVVVVGGGIGGLTVAALLAQRGMDVCLLERASSVGGCAESFEKFGYSFEQGDGLYTLWQPNEVHDRVFSELPVDPPEVRKLEPGYVVRLPDQSEISLSGDIEQFEANLRSVFPECADQAVAFYRKLTPLNATLRRSLRGKLDFVSASKCQQADRALTDDATQIFTANQQTTLDQLQGFPLRFRRFIDVQLQMLAQGNSAEVAYLYAALALSAPRDGMFAIRGGASTLAGRLAESIKRSGGKIRLDTPVLRLSYDSRGDATGVDLLSGETVTASKAIVSNLTLWDTYGKLVGLNRTPTEIRKQLKNMRSWGAYLLYLGMDEGAAASLTSDHLLTLIDWQDSQDYTPEGNQLLFSMAPSWDSRAPSGKRAVTIHAFTDVDDWFSFYSDETELGERDQQSLESSWRQLHSIMPELGDSIEVIDTANPRTFYDQTRRKLGMVGGVTPTPGGLWMTQPSYRTSLPNLFLVSDTTYPGGMAGITEAALLLANKLVPRN
jgi:C-3',4' desaturase CrtD